MTTEPTISDVLAAVQGIVVRLDKIEARLDKIETRLDKVEARLDALETRVEDIDEWRKTQPDMRLMFANSKVTLEKIAQVESQIRVLHLTVLDHASKNVTPGVIEAFHHDLTKLQKAEMEHAGRILRLEQFLNLTTP